MSTAERIPAPEPFVVGVSGRAYREVNGGKPFPSASPPDTVCDAFDFAGWRIRAASVRGLAHRHYSTVRQDHYELGFHADADRIVAVVCDGVGSLDQSHLAADVAAQTLLQQALDMEDTPGSVDEWTPLYERASEAIHRTEARRFGQTEPLMATTATIVVVDGVSGPGPWKVTLCGLGDSSVWTRRDGKIFGWHRLVGGKQAPDEELVLTNRTRSLPSGPITLEVKQVDLESGASVVICSDGVGDMLGDEVGETLASEWADPPRAINFAAHVGVGRMTYTDDRTAVAIWTP